MSSNTVRAIVGALAYINIYKQDVNNATRINLNMWPNACLPSNKILKHNIKSSGTSFVHTSIQSAISHSEA
jgi:hypothetical protein